MLPFFKTHNSYFFMATIDKIILVSIVLVEAVDGILPKCGEGGMEILIGEENQDNGIMGLPSFQGRDTKLSYFRE